MTTKAKQKAKEIFQNFLPYVNWNDLQEDCANKKFAIINAKKSSLILVEEILNFIKESEIENKYWIKFWKEVKEEIEKL
jgi:hypothetical protein